MSGYARVAVSMPVKRFHFHFYSTEASLFIANVNAYVYVEYCVKAFCTQKSKATTATTDAPSNFRPMYKIEKLTL